MKAKLSYASDWRRNEEILEINSLEDLMALQMEKGHQLVISTETEVNEDAESLSEMIASKTPYLKITVYDYYIE